MKKITTFLLVLVMGLFTACHDEIWDAIDGLDGRLTKLEELCKEMNTNIVSLQTIVSALQSNDYITGVVSIEKEGEVVGYIISFVNHAPITIYHGEDGENGKNGTTPVIGVAKHTDGLYYWTVDGQWLKDENGNMLLVTNEGPAGVNGITPQLKIESGYWYVSYDNGITWSVLGTALGEKGDKGDKGDQGDSMFQSVTEDADYVYFTLADGTVIKLKKASDEQPNSEYSYTITYEANGGDGTMDPESYFCGATAVIKDCAFTYRGYKFSGWNTKADGTGVDCNAGLSISVVKNITLYAQWKEKPVGEFSISATQKVAFSPGNLQYHPKNDTWRFAEKQTDYIGENNKYIAADYDGWIDLFGWSTGATNFGVSTSTSYADYSGDFVDWGTNQIGEDAPNTWRTLTYDEWDYLINSRPYASTLMGVAQVDGVNGLFLLPDNWECPSGITFKIGFASDYSVEAYGLYQTFTADEWMLMEAAGAIFLPATGFRYGSDVYDVQDGCYWSATENSSYDAYCLLFYSDEANMYYYIRYNGLSVRLVQDL